MNESSYGIVIEGIYDEAVIPELVRKIVLREVQVYPLVSGGVSRLDKQRKLRGYLRYLETCSLGRPVDKALVIRDSDGREPAIVQQLMAEKGRGPKFSFPNGVQFCIAHHAMEAWLLADENAIALVCGGRSVPRIKEPIEEVVRPKERLKRLLDGAGSAYDPEVCRQIAQRADLAKLRDRSPSFCLFEQKVLDC